MIPYNEIVNKIRECEPLSNELASMVNESKALNLVADDWEQQLEANPLIHRYREVNDTLFKPPFISAKGYISQSLKHPEDALKFIVAGMFYHSVKPDSGRHSFTVSNDVLTKIATAVIGELPEDHEMGTSQTFFMNRCCESYCCLCRDGRNYYTAAGTPVPSGSSPCTRYIKLYDGKYIRNSFIPIAYNPTIPGISFYGMALITINSKYSFPTKVALPPPEMIRKIRMGGSINHLVLFSPIALFPPHNISFGPPIEAPVATNSTAESDLSFFKGDGTKRPNDIMEAIPNGKKSKNDDVIVEGLPDNAIRRSEDELAATVTVTNEKLI